MTKTQHETNKEEFIKEYEALCLKHKVFIATDYDGIEATHLIPLSETKDSKDFFEWSINSLKR